MKTPQPSFETHFSDSLAPSLLVKTWLASIWRILHIHTYALESVRLWCWQRDPSDAIKNITAFAQSQQKILWKRRRKQEESCASTLADSPLSLLVSCGSMPRTWASPRPSCPMVQLIICSATRKLMLAYASLCSITAGCQGQNGSERGCLTDWLGIKGLGLD